MVVPRTGLPWTSPLVPLAWEMGEEEQEWAPPTAMPSLQLQVPTFPLSLIPDLSQSLASGNDVSQRQYKFIVSLFILMVHSQLHHQCFFFSSHLKTKRINYIFI